MIRPWGLALAIVLAAGPVSVAQDRDDAEPELPQGVSIEFVGQAVQTDENSFHFRGPVTVTMQDGRIQADEMLLRDRRYIEADGNILIVWKGNRISGTRLEYDLDEDRGFIDDAMGQVQNDYIFWARRAEKIGEDRVRLQKATVTTCTQPTPYWRFSVTSANIRINHYARMWNVVLRAGKVPIFYLPYLMWPVKKDRAVGLLMPEFNSTLNLGDAYTQELFIPLGRSADVTLLGRYYTRAGFGAGGELRFIPNQSGAASVSGFYINDQVAQRPRYRATYRQTQEFRNGFRMVADLNFVSDFNYYADFERDLNIISSPQILTRLEFSRNGPWTSLNVRELRREQLFSDFSSLTQQTLPEIEMRGRSRKMGKTPFYLAYETSLASIQQEPSGQPDQNSDYFRFDVVPTIAIPWSPKPWLDITPSVRYRGTVYTQHLQPLTGRVLDEELVRHLWAANVGLIGPKFYRIYGKSRPGAPLYKHTVEARVQYGYAESFDRQAEIIRFDEVDVFSGTGNQVSYALVQRLFARRPQARPSAPPSEEVTVLSQPNAKTTDQGRYLPDPPDEMQTKTEQPEEDVPEPPLEPVEIASLEFRQLRSFDQDLSVADLDRDGLNETSSSTSPVSIVGRYNPSKNTSVDLRSVYDILYKDFSELSVSGIWRNRQARVRFSFVHRNPLAPVNIGTGLNPIFVDRENDTQIRLTTGFTLLGGKLKLDLDGTYDADPPLGQPPWPERRYRLQYSNQCCTFTVEQVTREYSAGTDRDDFYFRIDLRGVGKLLSVTY